MQRKKNIQLLIILAVLLVVTIAIGLYKPGASTDFDKEQFIITNSEAVDSIIIGNNTLVLKGRQWKLNNQYTADIARVGDLFTVFESANVKRKASGTELEWMNQDQAIKVSVFGEGGLLKEYAVAENQNGTVSYFIQGDDAFVAHIPGYNFYIADLFKLGTQDWRTSYVFASNWTTLEKMQISYPDKQGVVISYRPTGYVVEDVVELDTAKMYNYLEQVSFLQVSHYLSERPGLELNALISIRVQDAGTNSIGLQFYADGQGNCYGLVDSTEWAAFRPNAVRNLIRSKQWFSMKK